MKIQNLNVSDVLLVSISPLIGYLITYWYFSGYYSYYNIPEELIDLGVQRHLVVATQFTGVSIFFYLLIKQVIEHVDFVREAEKHRRGAVLLLSLPAAVAIAVVLTYLSGMDYTFGLSMACFIILFINFGYFASICARKSKYQGTEVFPFKYIIIFLVVLFTRPIVSAWGHGDGKRQTEYVVVSKEKCAVLVPRNRSQFIMVRYQCDSLELTGEIMIVNVDDGLVMERSVVGRLIKKID